MTRPHPAPVRPRHRREPVRADPAGNEMLTAMTGLILLAGFAVEGLTIVSVGRFLMLHFLVGMLLIGPAALKVASTGYRFVRYYTGSLPYVRRGPPAPVLRLLGPLVILTSGAVLGTGVALALVGPGSGRWLFLHKASFVLWFGVMTIHVLNYAPRLPAMLAARRGGSGSSGGGGSGGGGSGGGGRMMLFSGGGRWLALAVSLAVGIAVAALTVHLSAKWGGGRSF